VKVLAEIPRRSSPDLRPGTLRRRELEAYTGLLGELGGVRTVLVTGDVPGRQAGAVGLATAAAAAGSRTALLECDLARPALADALGLAGAPGLREYLLGEALAEEILKPVVLAGPGSDAATDALVCVVAGRASDEAAALLDSERLARALAGLGETYELVVIDAPSAVSGAAAFAAADAVVVWAERDAPPPDLPVAATGLVVQA
jgi:polysaccharide biosynthesis transport protein